VKSRRAGRGGRSGFGEHIAASHGVAFARLIHAGANTILEMFLSSHDDITFQRSGMQRPLHNQRAPRGRKADRKRIPRTAIPFALTRRTVQESAQESPARASPNQPADYDCGLPRSTGVKLRPSVELSPGVYEIHRTGRGSATCRDVTRGEQRRSAITRSELRHQLIKAAGISTASNGHARPNVGGSPANVIQVN
jgi:hypothetical protein